MSSNDDSFPGPEPDSNQPPLEDTLIQRGADDVLDEGYSPPDRPPQPHWGETPYEEASGEPMEQQLDEEEPQEGQQPGPAHQADRAGRLADLGESEVAEDVGVAGGGAGAEEAAMRLHDDEGSPPEAADTASEALGEDEPGEDVSPGEADLED